MFVTSSLYHVLRGDPRFSNVPALAANLSLRIMDRVIGLDKRNATVVSRNGGTQGIWKYPHWPYKVDSLP